MTALNRQQAAVVAVVVVSALIPLLLYVAPSCQCFTPPSPRKRVVVASSSSSSSSSLSLFPPPPNNHHHYHEQHRHFHLASRLGDVMDDELGNNKNFKSIGGFVNDNDNDIDMLEDNDNDDDYDESVIDDYSDEELLVMAGDWDETVPQFNTIHLSGRVGNDPEIRYFDNNNNNNKVVVNLSLAVTRKYHSQERKALQVKFGQEETDWYVLEIWGQTAEFVNKYVDKGMRIAVIGSLETDEWKDKQTSERRTKPRVLVRDFNMLETRTETEARRGAGRSTGSSSNSSSGRGRSFYKGDGDDDDNYYGGPVSAGSGSGFF
jgi:single-strand DNA-binding protein